MEQERQQFQQRIRDLVSEDDPLSVYEEYIHWILKNDSNPDTTVLPVLEAATSKFKDDAAYKRDLRYLKICTLRAQRLAPADGLRFLKYLVQNDIGTTYSHLYEEYALTLEKLDRLSDAEAAFRRGIKRQARPPERLRKRYEEFKSRHPSSTDPVRGRSKTSIPPPAPEPSSQLVLSDLNPQRQQFRSALANARDPSPSAASTAVSTILPFTSTPYAQMLAPPAPGRRPEKLRFDLSLLFTEDHIEYSMQEARARSMGLLGKKWGPPPPVECPSSLRFSNASSSSSDFESCPVDDQDEEDEEEDDIVPELNDDFHGSSTRTYVPRKSLGFGAEPTMTINTREALDDVFGMYNSPEKTVTTRFSNSVRVGSKHAPIRKVEVSTPGPNPTATLQDSMPALKTPTPSFRPFVDENVPASSKKENATPAPKFKPYVDPDQRKTPFSEQASKPSFTTPRHALAPKGPVPHETPSPMDENDPPRMLGGVIKVTKLNAVEEVSERPDDVFSVFAPVQAKSTEQKEPQGPPSVFKPFTDDDSGARFTVFSRPPEQKADHRHQNGPATDMPAEIKHSVFTPFQDRDRVGGARPPAFTPLRDRGQGNPPPHAAVHLAANDFPSDYTDGHFESDTSGEDDYFDRADEQEIPPSSFEAPAHSSSGDSDFDEYGDADSAYQKEVPLGGRFGAFNVMTPITERTLEFTSTRSVFSATPSDHRGSSASVFAVQQDEKRVGESVAVAAAERLAAELQESDEDRGDDRLVSRSSGLQTKKPGHDRDLNEIEARTSSLSLADTLTRSSNFRPPNPCNPFDPPIISTLLTCVASDSDFYDLRHQEAKLLDGLQRFAKKARKTSSNSNNGGALDLSSTFPVDLAGQKFKVSEKLGEGGFGAVFKAAAVDEGNDCDDDDMDEDLDEEEALLVALKVVKPRNIWEYHVLRRLHAALPSSLQRSVIQPHALYAFKDESFLVLELSPQGTLLSVVNSAVSAGVSQQGACLDELLVIFFTIELLRLIERVHAAGFIHGDLKIDNCLLRLEEVPGGASAWGSTYSPTGASGWAYKGVRVIDFGRTIDTKLFPPGQKFKAEWPTDERDCPEIREDRPWTYETDYYGLAGIIYCMLFGKYMQSSAIALAEAEGDEGRKRYKIATPFKRYWQTEMWGRLFDVLLNSSAVRPDGRLPVCEELGDIRRELEGWLEKNCNRTSGTLKGLLKKVEMSVLRGM